MADITHDFPVAAPAEDVFRAVTTPEGLNAWWTLESNGAPLIGSQYRLHFGPGYDWQGTVTSSEPGRAFELEITAPDPDWNGTRVGFELEADGSRTRVRFHHAGWPEANGHYRSSCYCWAMYLRVLRRWIEHGEEVPYAERLDV